MKFAERVSACSSRTVRRSLAASSAKTEEPINKEVEITIVVTDCIFINVPVVAGQVPRVRHCVQAG